MDNNLNNGSPQSQTWIDPITGESYPSGNPHADINTSRVIGSAPPSQTSGVYNDPLPPGAVQQQAQRVSPMPQVQPMQPVQPMRQVQHIRQEQPAPPVYQTAGVTTFCTQCGSVLTPVDLFCPTCGSKVEPVLQQAEQLPVQQIQMVQQFPGQQIQVQQVQPVQVIVNNVVNPGTPKDKIVALLLCIFLGLYGAHRFYEGRIGTAILWMFTFGMFGIGWLYDVIRIACAPNPYYIK